MTEPGNAVCKAGLAAFDFVAGTVFGKGPCAE